MTHFSIKNATMFQSLPLKEHFRARWISLARKLLSPPTTPALSWTCGHPVWACMLDPENPVWGLMYFLQNLLLFYTSEYGACMDRLYQSTSSLRICCTLCCNCITLTLVIPVTSFQKSWTYFSVKILTTTIGFATYAMQAFSFQTKLTVHNGLRLGS